MGDEGEDEPVLPRAFHFFYAGYWLGIASLLAIYWPEMESKVPRNGKGKMERGPVSEANRLTSPRPLAQETEIIGLPA